MLACQKIRFYLPPNLHYLNCAYMAPLSRVVEAAGIRGLRKKRVPSTIRPGDFFAESDTARSLFARLIHADDPQRVALIPAASYGIATVARNTPMHRGQNIVVLHEQFPSNVYTWKRMEQQHGITLRTILPPEALQDRGARWNERILEAIDAQTAMVALPHVHWVDGTQFDLVEIGRRARAVSAAFVVDGTQSVGALPFDVRQIQPDALICAGYKWLLGPYGLGLAYYGPRYDDGIPLEENWICRKDSEHFAGLVAYQDAYQPGAVRYDVGERSNFTLVPMLVAGLRHVLEWGVEDIQAYCRALTGDVLAEAQNHGYHLEDPAWRSAHLFGIRVPAHLPVERLHQALTSRNIAVSVRGSAVRISPHVYNDAADLGALREAFHACLQPHSAPTVSIP